MGTWFDAMIAKHPDSERADDQHNNQLLASYLAGGNNPYTVSEARVAQFRSCCGV